MKKQNPQRYKNGYIYNEKKKQDPNWTPCNPRKKP